MKKVVILVLVLSCIGCRKSSTPDSDLLKTDWVLTSVQDTKTNARSYFPEDASRKISIMFTDSLNVLSFRGVCNSGSGTYKYDSRNEAITISNIFTTKIACKYVEWEAYVTQNLDEAYIYKINGNSLIIYTNGDYDLYFTKE